MHGLFRSWSRLLCKRGLRGPGRRAWPAVERLEAREVLRRAVARWRRIEVVRPGELHPTLMIRTYKSLPVRLVAR